MKRLDEAKGGFQSLPEAVDKTTPAGRRIIADAGHEMIRERTKLGLARARLEGRVGGNQYSLTPKQAKEALRMVEEGKSQSEVAQIFRVHPSTICRLVKERGVLKP